MGERRRAVVVGFDYYARYLSQLMNEQSGRWCLRAYPNTRVGTIAALLAMRNADALISFGGPGPTVALAEAANARRAPVVVIWAGTDVLVAAKTASDLPVLRLRGYENVSDGPWLVDELRNLGIEARYLPVTAVQTAENVMPLPRTFRVFTYLPEPRRAFYGEEQVYRIAGKMPHVEFVVIGAGKPNPNAPSNVTFRGYISGVPDLIDASTVLLRLPEHDGKSMLVLETLARARHVVWTHEFPGVHAVKDSDQAFAILRKLFEAHQSGALGLNETGRAYVRSEFSRRDIARRFETHLDDVVDTRSQAQRNGKKHRVAISGLGLFSAEVAEQVERRHPEWAASVLRTGSRLEVVTALLSLIRSDLWYSIGSPITDRWVHLCARLLHKPRVIHWVGSDIEYFRHRLFLRKNLTLPAIKHLTEVAWTAEELRELGVESEIVPLPLRQRANGVKPLPEQFTILLYLPKGRPEFYGQKHYESLLREFADQSLRVFVVGGAELQAPAGIELINLGWRDDLRDIYERCTVVIRFTPRDGLSLMVLEALSFGRYVMWSKPFPYTIHVRRQREISAALQTLLERHRRGELHAQYAAAEMVERRYSAEQTVDRILESWESVR